jgi:hypothetical protein
MTTSRHYSQREWYVSWSRCLRIDSLACGARKRGQVTSFRLQHAVVSALSDTGGGPSNGGSPSSGGASNSNVGGTAATGLTSTGGRSNTGGMSSAGGTASAPSTTGISSDCTPTTEKFSFFVTSQVRLFDLAQKFNGSTKGFGGDLRYGETGTDAGLRGADKICTVIAEASMPGNCKTWHAFLSTTTQNAIDRIGAGPWYDRIGRVFGNDISELLNTRPSGINSTIANDLPNEDGVLNHDAKQAGTTTNQDNHDMLTGSDTSGRLYNGTASNCNDWTSLDTSIRPRVGHTWPTPSFGGGGFPGGGDMGGITGVGDLAHWISALDENGCAPGYNLADSSMPGGSDGTVGGGGGYGGFYCFALSP